MSRKNNQRGAVDIILIAVFLVMVAGLGGYVYYQQQQAKKAYDATGQGVTVSKHKAAPKVTHDVNPRPNASPNLLIISELGIQIDLPNSIKDMTYVVEEQTDYRGKPVLYARLTTKSLFNLDSKCSASASPLGVIAKGSGTYPSSSEQRGLYYGTLEKQFGNFFITYAESPNPCDDNVQIVQLEQNQTTALKTALATIQVH